MPWKDKTMEELRREFVDAAKHAKNFSSLCREFGISRKTGYKWVERNSQSCELSDRSHAPLHPPAKRLPKLKTQFCEFAPPIPNGVQRRYWRCLKTTVTPSCLVFVPQTISCKETGVSAKRNLKSAKSFCVSKENTATNFGRSISKEIFLCLTVRVAFHSTS